MPVTAAPVPVVLPSLADQAERLVALGVHRLAGLTPQAVRAAAAVPGEGLLVVHPDAVDVRDLVPHLRRGDRPGFVVEDMTDVADFAPVESAVPPAAPLYVVRDPDRGDALLNRSPDEALPAILGAGRTPLLLTEGVQWVLQTPAVLERNRCFMTIGSRRRTPSGRLDARTPAVWVSNGTGRDGRERKDAPKVGWCWAGNRHTWLGFASASGREAAG